MRNLIFLILVLIITNSFTQAQPFNHKKGGIEFTIKKANSKQRHLKTVKKNENKNGNCVREYFQTSGTSNRWKIFNGDAGSAVTDILPGEIYDLSRFDGSFFRKIERHQRHPLKLALMPVNQGNVTEMRVENPKLSSTIASQGVSAIMNGLKRQNFGADFTVTSSFQRMTSEKQFKMSVGGSIPLGIGKISGSYSQNSNSSSETYTYYLELEERIFSISATGNKLASGNFFSNPNLSGPNFHPEYWAYVSKVGYGRRISIVIESSKSLQNIYRDGKLDVNTLYGNVNGSFSQSSNLQNAELNYSIKIQGGPTNLNFPLEDDGKKLQDILRVISQISNRKCTPQNAVAINFELKSIIGQQKRIVSTYSPIESQDEVCTALPKFMVNLTKIEGIDTRDGAADKTLELFGSFTVKAYTRRGERFNENGYEPVYVDLPTRGRTLTNAPGKRSFAKESHYIELSTTSKKPNDREFGPSDPKSGRFVFTLPEEALSEGYFHISVDATDRDRTAGDRDDSITGSGIRSFRELASTGNRTLVVNTNGLNGERVKFYFKFTLQ